MPRFMPGIHALFAQVKDVDGRDKPGHDVFDPDGRSVEAP
jgi:hypothetical protein